MKGYEDVEAGIVYWPMSVLRLRAGDPDRLIELGDKVLSCWRGYTDEEAFIFAETKGEPHNTITPIARKTGGMYELDLVLRNNITTDEFPLGVYHPHQELHHIKKENIGLIEVMGLAVLLPGLRRNWPGWLNILWRERIYAAMKAWKNTGDWVEEFLPVYRQKGIAITRDNVESVLQEEVGHVFARVLEDAGVYKCNEEGRRYFGRFLKSVGFENA